MSELVKATVYSLAPVHKPLNLLKLIFFTKSIMRYSFLYLLYVIILRVLLMQMYGVMDI